MERLLCRSILIVTATSILSACGGGGGGGSDDGGVGTLNVAVTDAPVDGVTEVWVEFYAVTLKPSGDKDCVPQPEPPEVQPIEETDELDTVCEEEQGGQLTYTFDTPRLINLKALTDGRIELLLDEEVPAGRYNWMKLHVNADFNEQLDSYVVEEGGAEIELRIPPDRLKLGNHFTVVRDGLTEFVIDWNLRMGLTNPVGQLGYKLQPSLRITDMAEYGALTGSVSDGLLPPINDMCSSDENTGNGNVVYIYQGHDVIPDDIDEADSEPFATADVRLNVDSGVQEYYITYLPPGNYTAAFTCKAIEDVIPDPDTPDLPVDDDLMFTPGQNTTIVDGQTSEVDFTSL